VQQHVIGDNYLSPLATIRNPHRLMVKTTQTRHHWRHRERGELERNDWPCSGREWTFRSPQRRLSSAVH
jgi:hypothetical protein